MKPLFLLTFVLVPFFAVAKEVDFNRDVRPILSQNCYVCHGPDKEHRKAKLRLDTEEGFQKVFSKKTPSDSEIIHRITSHDPDEIMPTPESGKSLNDEDLASNIKNLTDTIKDYQKENSKERGAIKQIFEDSRTGIADVIKAANNINIEPKNDDQVPFCMS